VTSFFDYFIGYTVSLHVEAQNMMGELDTFEGGSGLVLPIPEPKSFTHDAWVKGTNSSSGGLRTMRIVMPLGMALEILQKCDLNIFTTQAGAVECWPEDLNSPEQEVRFLNCKNMNTGSGAMQVTQVQREVPQGERKIHCKSVELPLNYHQRMIRYTFRTPPKTGERGETLEPAEWLQKCNRYIKQWMDLIIAEKKRQMHLPEHLWPPWPPRSSVSDVMTMPMVMWLSKAPRENKTRKRKSEGQTCPAHRGPPPPPPPPHAGYQPYMSSAEAYWRGQ